MKYRLIVRAVTDNDTNYLCPFAPEEDEIIMHLNTLVEDINNLSKVKEIKKNDFEVEIELIEPISDKELKDLMRPIFKEITCSIRFVSLSVI